ncbi:MAG: polyprenyl synthetase family protein [Dehalococcoidia bacterium]|nr:polyprenyl synthetase family protein [Dehalococcoidia bacterium]MCB9486825.1 polyprenyl synthetase family protein [Thermoflexaceae bacterium]
MASLGSGAPGVISRHRDAIEEALRAALEIDESPLAGPSRYVMGWQGTDGRPMEAGGKRIRPALALVAAGIFNADPLSGLPAAVAIELIHNFSLVHDEIQDHDDVRHGRPTAYTVWGPGQAINLGDFMYGRAIRALSESGADPSRCVRAMAVLMRAVEGMIAGQWRDISFESRERVSVDEYIEMIEGKTGVLLGASLEMGATLGGAAESEAATLGRWGTRLGLAFQAIDDYLGIWGDEVLTGKTTTGDIARRKKTLPIIHALDDPLAGPLIRTVYADESQMERYDEVVAALEAAGADALCRDMARRFANEAEDMVAALELDDAARDTLRSVGDYFCQRDF